MWMCHSPHSTILLLLGQHVILLLWGWHAWHIEDWCAWVHDFHVLELLQSISVGVLFLLDFPLPLMPPYQDFGSEGKPVTFSGVCHFAKGISSFNFTELKWFFKKSVADDSKIWMNLDYYFQSSLAFSPHPHVFLTLNSTINRIQNPFNLFF